MGRKIKEIGPTTLLEELDKDIVDKPSFGVIVKFSDCIQNQRISTLRDIFTILSGFECKSKDKDRRNLIKAIFYLLQDKYYGKITKSVMPENVKQKMLDSVASCRKDFI